MKLKFCHVSARQSTVLANGHSRHKGRLTARVKAYKTEGRSAVATNKAVANNKTTRPRSKSNPSNSASALHEKQQTCKQQPQQSVQFTERGTAELKTKSSSLGFSSFSFFPLCNFSLYPLLLLFCFATTGKFCHYRRGKLHYNILLFPLAGPTPENHLTATISLTFGNERKKRISQLFLPSLRSLPT